LLWGVEFALGSRFNLLWGVDLICSGEANVTLGREVAQGRSCSGKVNLLWDGKIALGIKKQSGLLGVSSVFLSSSI